MRALLEGRRLGFALRPLFAAAVVGVGIGVTLLDLVAWFAWGVRDTNALVVGSLWLAGAAVVLSALGLVTALAEMNDSTDEDRFLARLDVLATVIALLLYAASATLRAADRTAAAPSPPAFLLAVAALIVAVAGLATAAPLYAPREWEEIEEVTRERHGRRRAAAR